MHTLTIQSIFDNLGWYQKNYIQILQTPEQYYQSVEYASIKFSIVSDQKLYLGDLLQLWFGHKWTSSFVKNLQSLDHDFWYKNQTIADEDFYIYSLKYDQKINQVIATAWLEDLKKESCIQLNIDCLPFYLSFIALERPTHAMH